MNAIAQLKEIDERIGKRICLRRKQLGKSLKTIGGKVGLTYQQLQKYEHGINRISVARLLTIADALNVNIEYFFDNIQRPSISGLKSYQDEEMLLMFKQLSPDTKQNIYGLLSDLLPRQRSANQVSETTLTS